MQINYITKLIFHRNAFISVQHRNTNIILYIFFHLETTMQAIHEERYQRNHMTMGMLEGWLRSGYLSLGGCVNWLGV